MASLTDPDTRRNFLVLVASGQTRSKAAEALGISASSVSSYARRNPDFADQMSAASDMAFDSVEQVVRAVALDQEHPNWSQAVNHYLKLKKEPKVAKVDVTVTNDSAPPLERILAFQKELEARALEAGDSEEL